MLERREQQWQHQEVKTDMVVERVCPAVVEETPIRADAARAVRAVGKAADKVRGQAASKR